MRRRQDYSTAQLLAYSLREIERLQALTTRVTDGRCLVVTPGSGGGSGGTTPGIEPAGHVLYGTKHSKALAVRIGAGLSVDYDEGHAVIDAAYYSIAAGNLAGLADNTTNYVFVDHAGAVNKNTTGFPLNGIPLATAVTAAGVVTSVTDARAYLSVESPVTLGANLAAEVSLSGQALELCVQAPNTVFVGPTAGVNTYPTFRLLDSADIPDISGTYLTPGAHTAIGDAAPHHAAITLAASAAVLLDLTDQAVSLDTQAANTFLAGRADAGVAQAPTFRAIVALDLAAGAPSGKYLRDDMTWATPAGGAGGHVIWDEATPLAAEPVLAFVGAGVTATDDAGVKTIVTIPGVSGVLLADGTIPLTANWVQSGAFAIRTAGYLRVGSSVAPLNTTAGDLTTLRLVVGDDVAHVYGDLLYVQSASHVPIVNSESIMAVGVIWAPNGTSAGNGRTAFAGVVNVVPTAADDGIYRAIQFLAAHTSGAFNISTLAGCQYQVTQGVALTTLALTYGTSSYLTVSAGTVTAHHGFSSGFNGTGGAAITSLYHFIVTTPGGYPTAMSNHYGLSIPNLGNAAVTTAVGIGIGLQTGAVSNNIGIYMGGGTMAAIWCYSDVAANGAFVWGSTRDTNLYRSVANVLKTDDSLHISLDLWHLGANLGFYNHATATQQTVTGKRNDPEGALKNLLAALAMTGLIVDSTTAS